MLKIKIEDSPASELRGWLFQVCFTYQDHESYEVIKTLARKCLNQERSAMCDEAIQLRDRALRQRENWINLPRSLRNCF